MSPLTWQVDIGAAAAHVCVDGRPDADSLIELRKVLWHHCGRRSGDVTVDLAGLAASDQAAVIRMAELTRRASDRATVLSMLANRMASRFSASSCP